MCNITHTHTHVHVRRRRRRVRKIQQVYKLRSVCEEIIARFVIIPYRLYAKRLCGEFSFALVVANLLRMRIQLQNAPRTSASSSQTLCPDRVNDLSFLSVCDGRLSHVTSHIHHGLLEVPALRITTSDSDTRFGIYCNNRSSTPPHLAHLAPKKHTAHSSLSLYSIHIFNTHIYGSRMTYASKRLATHKPRVL